MCGLRLPDLNPQIACDAAANWICRVEGGYARPELPRGQVKLNLADGRMLPVKVQNQRDVLVYPLSNAHWKPSGCQLQRLDTAL